MSGEKQADAAAIIEAMERLAKPVAVPVSRGEEDAMYLVAVPKGMSLVDPTPYFEQLLNEPRRRRGTAKVRTLRSFIDHVNRFADKDSALFASDEPRSPRLTSVLDYHREGSDGMPRFGEHRSIYDFPVSDEWASWTNCVDFMDQRSFAEFLEDRIVDILDPAAVGEGSSKIAGDIGITLAGPTRILDLSRGLSVRVDSQVAQHINLSTGETALSYAESHTASAKDGGQLKVPNGFVIAIPVFRGGPAYQIPVRLRYRVRSGAVTWRVALHRADDSFRHAFEEACEQARTETGLSLFYGSPE